jgi:hypothetical protein
MLGQPCQRVRGWKTTTTATAATATATAMNNIQPGTTVSLSDDSVAIITGPSSNLDYVAFVQGEGWTRLSPSRIKGVVLASGQLPASPEEAEKLFKRLVLL